MSLLLFSLYPMKRKSVMNAIKRSQQTIRAIELIEAGFRTSIIVTETDLKPELIRSLHRELKNVAPKSGQLPEAASILRTNAARIEAFALLCVYMNIEHCSHHQKINIDDVITCHQLYIELRNQCRLKQSHYVPLLDVNEAWILIRGLLSNLFAFKHCQCCECDFLILQHQGSGTKCPFCRIPRRFG